MSNKFKAILRYYYRDNPTPNDIDITSKITNSMDIAISAQRDGFSGVVSEIQLDLELKRDSSIEILDEIYEDYCVQGDSYGDVFILMYVDYSLLKRFSVNLSTFSKTKTKFAVNIESPSLMNFIKSKGDTEFLCPVGEIPFKGIISYTPMQLHCNAMYQLPLNIRQENIGGDPGRVDVVTCSVSFSSIQGFGGISKLFCRSQNSVIKSIPKTGGAYDANQMGYSFLTLEQGKYSRITFIFDFTIHLWSNKKPSSVKFGVRNIGNYLDPDLNFFINGKVDYIEKEEEGATDWDGDDVSNMHHYKVVFKRGGVLQNYYALTRKNYSLLFECVSTSPKTKYIVKVEEFNRFSILWQQPHSGTAGYGFRAVTIESLINKIFEKANRPNYKAIVELQEDFDNIPLLVAAEEAKGKDDAAYHAKLSDLIKMLKVMGYEYVIDMDEDDQRIVFKRRHAIYNISTPRKIEDFEKSDVRLSHDIDNTYSLLKIGFNKTKIDNPTATLDPVGVVNYSTGRELPQPKTLEMVSPIRADLFGLEACTWDREKLDSEKTDTDIFLIDCSRYGGNNFDYYIWDKVVVEVIGDSGFRSTYKNALRTPFATVGGINRDFLFSWAKSYMFSDGDIYSDQLSLYVAKEGYENNYLDRRWTLSYVVKEFLPPFESLFKQKYITLSFGVKNKVDFNGAFLVEFDGEEYYGFIKEYEYNPITKKAGDLKLIITNK